MFVISEISPQFGNDLNTAEQMILQSKMAGANAAKLQLYPAEMFSSEPVDAYVKSRELDFDAFKRLKNYGEKIGLPVFATAFDDERLSWCIELDQQYYKVATRQHRENPDLVDRVISLGKPVFVSIPSDFDKNAITPHNHCIYLHCVAQYPTLLEDVVIPDFSNSLLQGLSDHSPGIAAALLAAARGAEYLEEHFTLDHAGQRHNEKAHFGAMTADELRDIKLISTSMERLLVAET